MSKSWSRPMTQHRRKKLARVIRTRVRLYTVFATMYRVGCEIVAYEELYSRACVILERCITPEF